MAATSAVHGGGSTLALGLEALTPEWGNQEVSTGTAIMAMQFDGGMVLGADSRTTTGFYIVNRVTDKLTPNHDHIFRCHSGSTADTQAVAEAVTYQLGFHSIELNESPLVHTATSLFKEMLPIQRRSDGRNHHCGLGPSRRRADVLSSHGRVMVRQSFATGGSRSSYVRG